MLVHSRREPVRNSFRYPLSFFVLDLDELPDLERRLKLFSINRRNAVTLRDKDHFDGTRPVKEAVVHFCAERGVEVDRVLMLAQLRVAGYVFNPVTFFGCLKDIWNRESGWRYDAENPSGAYGIPQALPGSKMSSAGADWQTNPATQIKWGLGYIKAIYGDPCKAWAFEEANGYY